MLVLLMLSVCVVNAGYGFEGTLTPLGEFRFVSKSLAGPGRDDADEPGNRFRDTWLAHIPVPLPRNYVMGIDVTKRELEQRDWSYLWGRWRPGWYSYYLLAALVKVPLGGLGLACLRLGNCCWARQSSNHGRYGDFLVMALTSAAILALLVSQPGLQQFRYALPLLPIAFVWTSGVARLRPPTGQLLVLTLLISYVVSSMAVYPHSLSFFSVLAKGPTNGHNYLLNSELDWGQDLYYLRSWLDEHPTAHPVYFAYSLDLVDPQQIGITYKAPPITTSGELPPGWYAVSVNRLYGRDGTFSPLHDQSVVAYAGYSIHIYFIEAPDDI